jgi:benzoylformate decarboxylase
MADPYTGADLFVDALESYGVTHVFGNPGTTELPITRALGDSDLEYMLALHEDMAVGMASGYARDRRYHAHDDPPILPLGVANLHVTPGLAHGLGNLYDAKAAGAPLLVTAGNHSTDFRHEDPLLSGDLVAIAEEFTKWSTETLDVAALPTVLRRAVRTALTPPTGPVFLSLPLNVTLAETRHEFEPLGPIPDAGRGDPGELDRAAEVLANAEEVVLVVGDGVARAGTADEAVSLAEAAGARVHGEILGSEVNFPASHDQWVSHTPPDEDLARSLMDADVLVFVGCSTHTTITRHDAPLIDGETTCVHLGDDPSAVGKRYRTDSVVLGDPGSLMAGLASRLADRLDDEERTSRLESVRGTKSSVEGVIESSLSTDSDDPRASKAGLVDAMYEAAPDALIVDESVTSRYAMLARWPFETEGFIGHKGGGLGYGLPATLGAAVAESQRPADGDGDGNSRPVIGFVGDGSYLYYPHTLYTAARYDLDLTVIVSDNRNYRILKDNLMGMFGGEESDHEFVGMDFEPHVDIPKNAESHGARGHLVEKAEGITPALEDALAEDGPDVLDVLVHD